MATEVAVNKEVKVGAPKIVDMKVVPVAGYDSMLMNLSGAHGPYFTRNIVILTADNGETGLVKFPAAKKSERRWKTQKIWSSGATSENTKISCATSKINISAWM